MSLWHRLRHALWGQPTRPEAGDPGPVPRPAGDSGDGGQPVSPPGRETSPGPPAPPAIDPSADELFLKRLLHELSGKQAGKRGRDLHAAVDRLLLGGQPRLAIECLGRLARNLSEDDEVLLRLSELLCQEGEPVRAVPVLRQVLSLPEALPARRHRAHFLLAGFFIEQGDDEKARRELSAILMDDLDYPRARTLLSQVESRVAAKSALLGLPRDGAKNAGAPQGRLAGPGPIVQALPTLYGAAGIRHQRYQLLRELGRGSAGTVYLARDMELSRDMAIKIFHLGDKNAGSTARAWNEARLTAAVRHPGVVAIYELDDERNLMVMELCQGGTLRQRLAGGRLPGPVALHRARELLDTLATVHRTGVVHGDLKPGNLLFRGPGQTDGPDDAYGDLVVADFGTARLYRATSATEAGAAAGTLGYLSPERRRQPEALLPADDLYAVGAIMLEMLLGSLPLSRYGLLRGDQPKVDLPDEVAAELSGRQKQVQELISSLLAENPGDRPTAQQAHQIISTF